MGVEYSAVIVYGLPRDEVRHVENRDGTYGSEHELEFIPRGYDSSDGIVGVVLRTTDSYDYEPIGDIVVPDFIKTQFRDNTSLNGKLFLTVHGY